jgi:hypothetical protein
MTDQQLVTLFYRKDIDLRDLRKKMFFDTDKKRDEVKSAAISHNFDLEYAEFAEVLGKPDKERVKILKDLAFMAHDLSLCLYDAIHDILFGSVDVFDADYADSAKNALERKLKELEGGHRKWQLRELRLYRLAKEAVPWKKSGKAYPPFGELEFLSKLMVEGNTWGTFMAFSKAWAESRRTDKLEKRLPRIYEVTEDGLDYETEADDEDLEEPKEGETIDIAELQAGQDRQRLLLYVVIALLIWLLIKSF